MGVSFRNVGQVSIIGKVTIEYGGVKVTEVKVLELVTGDVKVAEVTGEPVLEVEGWFRLDVTVDGVPWDVGYNEHELRWEGGPA